MGKQILIVEDEVQISRLMQLELRRAGYETTAALDGHEGLSYALKKSFDLIILDLMLPGMNGFEVCREIRKKSDVPVLMVTARDDIKDVVSGLDLGADDYITKPFDMAELLARIRRALNRNEKKKDNEELLLIGRLTIDNRSHTVTVDNTPVELTKREYELLFYLAKNKDSVFSREKLMTDVWGYDYFGDTNVVDVYIRYLRSKIDDRFKTKYIKTVRGTGYMLTDRMQNEG